MPTRLCLEPRCPNPQTYRGRCADHARITNRATHLGNRRIYNSKRWAILRRRVLFEQPLCRCGDIATDVHHRQDIAKGGDPWVRTNLEALCHACHSRLTRQEQATQ